MRFTMEKCTMTEKNEMEQKLLGFVGGCLSFEQHDQPVGPHWRTGDVVVKVKSVRGFTMVRYFVLGILICGMLVVEGLSPKVDRAANAAGEKLKIGTYDSRAIAIAWAASIHNPVGEKMKEYEAAKKAKDQAKIKELEAWGPSHQKQLHFQGFGRVPVDELLVPVHLQIQEYLAEKDFIAVTMACDQVSDRVEIIDITLDLVQLFDPSERTLESVKQVMRHKPLTLVELSELDENK